MLDGKLIEHNDTSKLFTTPAIPAPRLTLPVVSGELGATRPGYRDSDLHADGYIGGEN